MVRPFVNTVLNETYTFPKAETAIITAIVQFGIECAVTLCPTQQNSGTFSACTVSTVFQKEINALRPMEGEMPGQIQGYYRVGLTWTSNALEGNSLTESETKVLLEDGLTVGGKPLRDVFEAGGHAKVCDFMFSVFHNRRIDEQTVQKMHELFCQNIEPEYAGRYRDVRVLITGSQYPVATPEKVQKEMDGLFAWVQKERDACHPVESAARLHKRFVFIHPFRDGNVTQRHQQKAA